MDTVFGKIRVKRKPLATLGTLDEGEPGLATDTGDFFIGWDGINKPIGGGGALPSRVAEFNDLTVTAQSIVGFDELGDMIPFPMSDPAADLIDETSFAAMVNKLGGAPSSGAGGLLRETSPRFTTDIAPAVDGLADVGAAANRVRRVYLKSGGIIDFSNGGYLITHSTGNIAFGGSISVSSAVGCAGLTASVSVQSPLIEPITNGGGTLGNTSFGFSAMHLSTGGVINIAAGNWVGTHTSGVFTVTTGDFRVATEGTNAASVLTVGGTAALKRAVHDKGGAEHNVRAYGAVGDGVANDTAAIQAALDAIKAAGGGRMFLPIGTYKITASLVYDVSAIANDTNRLVIEGAGVKSCISLLGVATAAISYIGRTANPEGHLVLRSFRVLGDATVNSIGIKLRGGLAFNSLENVVVYSMGTGMDFSDVDQTNYLNCTVRFCRVGINIGAAVSVTSCNSHHFVGCTIGNNSFQGVAIVNPNSVSFFGGSIQYNSTVGAGTGNFGVLIQEAGNGYGNVNFVGVVFEGNGGLSDLIVDQTANPCVVNVIGCSFLRTASFGPTVGYAVTNIWMIGTAINVFLNLHGNTFRGTLAGYTPSAARPCLTITNAGTVLNDDGTNFYDTPVEAPAWRGNVLVPRATSWASEIYMPQLTADVNDYDLGQVAAIVAVSSNASRFITGIVARPPGSLLILSNVGVNPVMLADMSLSVASAAANRFAIGFNRALDPGDSVMLFRDGANQKWCVLNHGGKTMFQCRDAWIAWAPVVTATTGAYTTVTAAGFYKQIGNTIHWNVKISITNAGTGTGKPKLPVPVGTFRGDNCGVGIEVALNGKSLTAMGLVTASNFWSIQYYDNTTAFPTGTVMVLSGTYEIP